MPCTQPAISSPPLNLAPLIREVLQYGRTVISKHRFSRPLYFIVTTVTVVTPLLREPRVRVRETARAPRLGCRDDDRRSPQRRSRRPREGPTSATGSFPR